MAASLLATERPPMALDSTASGGRARGGRRQRLRACGPLRAPHRVNLRGAFGQWMCGPTLAAILAAEHLTAAGRAVHALGLPRVEGEREHRGPRLHAHVDFRPAYAAVLAAEERADFALKVGARG